MNEVKHKYKNTEAKKLLNRLEEYDKQILTIAKFLEECCVISLSDSVKNKILYKEYARWCEQYQVEKLGKTLFGRNLDKFGLNAKNIGYGYYRMGLRLKKTNEECQERLFLEDMIDYIENLQTYELNHEVSK